MAFERCLDKSLHQLRTAMHSCVAGMYLAALSSGAFASIDDFYLTGDEDACYVTVLISFSIFCLFQESIMSPDKKWTGM